MNDAVLCSKIKTDNVSVSVPWDVCPRHYIRQRAIPQPCRHHHIALPLPSQRTRTGNEDSPAMSGPPPSPIRVPVALGRYRALTRCILCVPRIPCPPRAPQLRRVSVAQADVSGSVRHGRLVLYRHSPSPCDFLLAISTRARRR